MMQWHETEYGDRQRPPILFLHGFLGVAEDWQPIAEALQDEFCGICVDLPGHGATRIVPSQAPLGFEAIAASLIARLDTVGVARCALAGYSMGGRLALYLALAYPARFSKLILESASPGLRSEEERQQRSEHDEQIAGRLESAAGPEAFRAFLEWWYEQPLFASLSSDAARREALIASRLRNDPFALAQALRALSTGAQPNLWERLDELQPPTLLLVGERDRKYRQIAESMSEGRPRMAVQSLTGCGHNVHYENPGGYTTVLRAFLRAI